MKKCVIVHHGQEKRGGRCSNGCQEILVAAVERIDQLKAAGAGNGSVQVLSSSNIKVVSSATVIAGLLAVPEVHTRPEIGSQNVTLAAASIWDSPAETVVVVVDHCDLFLHGVKQELVNIGVDVTLVELDTEASIPKRLSQAEAKRRAQI